jgi:hypothetical protein
MGSALSRVRQAYIDDRGEDAWEVSRRAIADFWGAIETGTDNLCLDYATVRLYQDGLPVCGIEQKIVSDLAAQGIASYRILLKLVERGATLEGTEDPELLRKEYELIMSAIPGAEGKGQAGLREAARHAELKHLLEQRDLFIARRIDSTLLDGETGILFLGALHGAVEKLPSTIRIMTLPELLQPSGALGKG